ncbi:ribosomal protein S5 domain 2-like protein [Trametes cingulata]|nr:ribosomal protein S5 domain 2-like protein [Trametes cingulata]
MSNLDAFVKSAKPPPNPVATSQEIRDRGSTFVASIFSATTPDEARKAVRHLKHVAHGSRPATHEIAAWRCMVLKPGKTGLGGPDDFEVVSGFDEDGEKYAGAKLLKVLTTEGVMDAVVVVSRWFGGEMLGPVRFDHIEMCAREACRAFRLKDDVADAIATLNSLDDILASLRAELASLSAPPSSSEGQEKEQNVTVITKERVRPSYAALEESLDIAKAKRLISARENSIRSVKQALQKARARDAAEKTRTEKTST